MVAHLVDRRPTPDGLLSSFATKEDLDVHHVVLDDRLGVVHLGAVENYIAWLHLVELQVDGQRVELVALVAWAQLETELFLQVADDFPDEATAVEEERRLVKWVAGLPVALSIGHTEVLLALANEFLAQPVFELLGPVALLVVGLARYWLRLLELRPFLLLELRVGLAWRHVLGVRLHLAWEAPVFRFIHERRRAHVRHVSVITIVTGTRVIVVMIALILIAEISGRTFPDRSLRLFRLVLVAFR